MEEEFQDLIYEEEFQEFKAYVMDSLDEFKYAIEDLKKEVKQLQHNFEMLNSGEWEDECSRIESDLSDEISGVRDDVYDISNRLDSIETELAYQ